MTLAAMISRATTGLPELLVTSAEKGTRLPEFRAAVMADAKL